MLVSCSQMQAAEEAAFSRGVSAEELMEQAGRGIAAAVRQFFQPAGTLVLSLGKGNNAGDALVAARELKMEGWTVFVRLSGAIDDFKPLPRKHFDQIADEVTVVSDSREIVFPPGRPVVCLDGLLGIGAQGPLRGEMAGMADEMNELRQLVKAKTVAMDIPSGVNGDTGEPCDGAVIADLTVTVAQVKAGLVADAAVNHVGRLAVVRLGELEACHGDEGAILLTPDRLRPVLPIRSTDAHKGSAGRVVLVAGSRGFLGAAVLASLGALRSGAGLVTLVVREDDYALMAPMCPPEVMVKPVRNPLEALDMKADAWVVGPGLGFGNRAEVLEILKDASAPAVVDADALTILGEQGIELLSHASAARLLTPHPGEMARLVANRSEFQISDRRRQVETLAAAFPSHGFLLKGSRTVIAADGRPTWFNSTGHPGMASGGMGDVLSGACGAWLGQGLSVHDAAGVAAWSCGRAAELATRGYAMAEESVLATEVAAFLGRALGDLKRGGY